MAWQSQLHHRQAICGYGTPTCCQGLLGDDKRLATNAAVGSAGLRCQYLDLPFATAPLGVARGHELYVSSATNAALQLPNFIYGAITVISVTGNTVRVGFPSQVLNAPIASGTLVSFHKNAVQEPLQDWSLELLVSPTNPVETRFV